MQAEQTARYPSTINRLSITYEGQEQGDHIPATDQAEIDTLRVELQDIHNAVRISLPDTTDIQGALNLQIVFGKTDITLVFKQAAHEVSIITLADFMTKINARKLPREKQIAFDDEHPRQSQRAPIAIPPKPRDPFEASKEQDDILCMDLNSVRTACGKAKVGINYDAVKTLTRIIHLAAPRVA